MAGPRGIYRSIHSVLLNDEDFRRLTAPARQVLVFARISDKINTACLFVFDGGTRLSLIEQTGLEPAVFEAALEELKEHGWIKMSGLLCWIVNGVKHDPNLNLYNSKQLKGVVNVLNSLPSNPLIAEFCDYYGILDLCETYRVSIPITYPIDRVSKGNESPPIGYRSPSDRVSKGNESPPIGYRSPSDRVSKPVTVAVAVTGAVTGTGTVAVAEDAATGKPDKPDREKQNQLEIEARKVEEQLRMNSGDWNILVSDTRWLPWLSGLIREFGFDLVWLVTEKISKYYAERSLPAPSPVMNARMKFREWCEKERRHLARFGDREKQAEEEALAMMKGPDDGADS